MGTVAKLFGAGVPTAPDVTALLEEFDLKRGDEVSYEDISRVIHAKVRSDRFDTVVDKWRREVLDRHNLTMECVRGVGFRVVHEHERINLARNQARRATRGMGRSLKELHRIERKRLTAEQRTIHDHALLLYGKALDVLSDAHKQIAGEMPGVVKQLPRSVGGTSAV